MLKERKKHSYKFDFSKKDSFFFSFPYIVGKEELRYCMER